MASDYQMLMSILAKNMTEGADENISSIPIPLSKSPSGKFRYFNFLLVIFLIKKKKCFVLTQLHYYTNIKNIVYCTKTQLYNITYKYTTNYTATYTLCTFFLKNNLHKRQN